MAARSGDLVGGRYRLGRQIGAGGMATVFEALDVTLERRVAVKFLVARHRNPETVERRFLREARIAAAVRHPNVVEVYDFGVADQTPYMVMELLEGASLAERTRTPPLLTLGELFDLVDGLLAGLAAVHEAGIVHRDIKPENIFLASGAEGTTVPKVFDFGVSRIQTDDGPISASTSVEGYLVGTPHYMSSEQARGLRDLSPATDVYSVGVVLYEHLVGRLPFDADLTGDLVIAIATSTPRAIVELRPELGRPLSDFVDRAMAKLPADRWPNALEMRRALRAIRDAQPELDALPTETVVRSTEPLAATLDPPPDVPLPWDDAPLEVDYGLPEETPRAAPPRRARWPIAAAIAAAAALGLALAGWIATRPRTTAEVPRSGAPTTTALVPAAPTETAGTVTIRLRGMPEGAALELDGAPARGEELVLRRGEDEHRIRVEAEGMDPFEAVVVADADRTVQVSLTPHAVAEPAAEPSPPGSRGRRGRSAPGGPPAERTGGIFRTPDF